MGVAAAAGSGSGVTGKMALIWPVPALPKEGASHFYVCGLKSMEEGVVLALRDVATEAGLDWDTVGASLKRLAPAPRRRPPQTG